MSVSYATVGDRLVREVRNSVITRYVSDPLGSVIQTRNSSGTLTSSTEFWPFGEVRTSTGANPSPWGFVGTLGYFADLASRLYVRARYYRTNLSRWMTVDPLWLAGQTYAYALNGPCQNTDRFGLQSDGRPTWDPDFWNKPGIIDNNNCYSYACDWPWGEPAGQGKPQPGDKSGGAYNNFPNRQPSCANIIANAKRDGLIFDIPKGGCRPPSHKVCLYVTTPGSRPQADYHWERQDDDGYWSSKPGLEPPERCYPGTTTPIANPDEDARRRGYPKKCGCFCAKGKSK